MIKQPGQTVSINQWESKIPGLIAQLKGLLTQKRYQYATILVDQYPRLSYVHLQKMIMSEEMVQAKKAFKRYVEERCVTIKHYHADNGHFTDNGFINNCKAKNQCITYCGVNADFQNGIAKKRIRDLQEATHTSLLFAIHKWPKMVSIHLWPYAMHIANKIMISTPTLGKMETPQELFGQVNIAPKIKHFHKVGCLVYMLDHALQEQAVPMWKSRSWLGIYLGPSPNHLRTVILNPQIGCVTPLFHVKHDNFFETIKSSETSFDFPPADWKYLSSLYSKQKPNQGETE